MSETTHWQRLKDLIAEAEALDAGEQAVFLERACGDDAELLQEARALLGLASHTDGFMQVPAMPEAEEVALEPGTQVGAFRIVGPLGAGGMGDVYLAERDDGAYEERVAVKVIRLVGAPSELKNRFLSERQLLAELRHSNIAQLLDAGALEDGRPYFVMELVDGEPIDDFCRRHGLSLRRRLRLMTSVAGAVAHAHRHLVVHRDLKPGNIFVTQDGVPKLLDFGVAKDLRDAGRTPSTRLLVPMTPEYASPEQLTGGAITTATDVYALGVVLYELLTGSSPFGGDQDPMSGRSQSSPPSRPSSRVTRGELADRRILRRQLAGDLDALILKALHPDPASRYLSVEAMQRDLDNFLSGLPLEARDGVAYRVGKWSRRHWKALAAAGVAIALTAGWQLERADRRQAEEKARARLEQSNRMADVTKEMGDYLVDLLMAADPGRSGEQNQALESVVAKAARLLDDPKTFGSEPLIRATFLGAVGQVQRLLGRPEEAEPRLQECLKIRKERMPSDHSAIAVAANNLGLALRGLGELEKARDRLREAESILFAKLAEEPEIEKTLASVWSNLGGLEKALGRFDEAIVYFEQALATKERLEPDDPNILAAAHKNLAAGLIAAGRLDEAEIQLKYAAGKGTPSAPLRGKVQSAIDHYLGILARDRGDHVTARRHLESAYQVRLQTLGANARQTLKSKEALDSLDSLGPSEAIGLESAGRSEAQRDGAR